MKHKIVGLLVMIVLSSSCVLAADSAVGTDDFLEYTLKDIRDKMDSALSTNNQLSAKNASIRKRIMMLQKSLRDMGKKKIGLQENISVLRNFIKLEAKELDVHKKRVDALAEQKRSFDYQADSIRKNIETQQLEQGLLAGSVDDLNLELKGLQARAHGDQKSVLLQYYSEQREAFVDMLREAKKRLREKESQRDLLEVDAADNFRLQEREYHKREQYKERVASLHLLVEEKNAETDLLHRNQDRLREGVYQERERVQKDIDDLNGVAKQMRQAKKDIAAQRARIDQDFQLHEKALRSYQDLLMQENEYLFQKKVLLEEAKEFIRQANGSEYNTVLTQTSLESVQEDLEKAAEENRKIEDTLAAQKQEQGILEVNYARMEKEIKEQTEDLLKQSQETKRTRETKFGKKKAEVQAMMAEQKNRLSALAKEESGLKRSIEGLTKSLQDKKTLNSDKKIRVKDLERVIGELSQRQKFFDDQIAGSQDDMRKAEKKVKDDIDALKMRKKALSGSLDVVEKKYQASQTAVEGFASEEDELREYLKVITLENQSLQKKKQGLEVRVMGVE